MANYFTGPAEAERLRFGTSGTLARLALIGVALAAVVGTSAYLFFLTFVAHFGAILFHTLIVRDGIIKRMAPWNI
jgi:cytochrome b561